MSLILAHAHIANFKRIKVVDFVPKKAGLTKIGGKNKQGKTSALNAIQMGFSGGKYKPSNIHNNNGGPGELAEANFETDTGYKVRIFGINGTIEVIDPQGKKGGITLFGDAISTFAVDLRKFIHGKASDKHDILVAALGLGEILADIEKDIKEAYNARTGVNAIARQAKAALDAATKPDPKTKIPEEVDAEKLHNQIQEAQQFNDDIQEQEISREQVSKNKNLAEDKIEELLAELEAQRGLVARYEQQIKNFEPLPEPKDIEPLQEQLKNAKAVNETRTKLLKAKEDYQALLDANGQAIVKAGEAQQEYEAALQKKHNAIALGDMPDPDLTLEDGKLLYKGQEFDCISGAEELIVSTKIGVATQKESHFVLIDGLEAMDADELAKYDEWATENNIQIIGTVVTDEPEKCSIFIEDGQNIES